ncbi:MAG: stage V sporulation protein SpoVM [Clostridia bacterium]|nr:stage V sporulation protein SpoVM [Clostridia bacterium]
MSWRQAGADKLGSNNSCIRSGACCVLLLLKFNFDSDTCRSDNNSRHRHSKIRRSIMQVVLVKSPKALRGILRLIFGIKKEDIT